MRMKPLQIRSDNPFAFGSLHTSRWLGAAVAELLESTMDTAKRRLRVAACSFFKGVVGYACAASLCPVEGPRVVGWVIGEDSGGHSPVYLYEVTAFRALGVVWETLQQEECRCQLIHVAAGSVLFCWRMLE